MRRIGDCLFVEALPQIPETHTSRSIHFQEPNSRAASRSRSNDDGAIQRQMVVPTIFARIEQQDNSLCQWVNGGQVRTLVQVATVASEGETLHVIASLILPCHDVFDVKRRLDGVLLKATVLAPIFRAVTYELAAPGVH